MIVLQSRIVLSRFALDVQPLLAPILFTFDGFAAIEPVGIFIVRSEPRTLQALRKKSGLVAEVALLLVIAAQT